MRRRCCRSTSRSRSDRWTPGFTHCSRPRAQKRSSRTAAPPSSTVGRSMRHVRCRPSRARTWGRLGRRSATCCELSGDYGDARLAYKEARSAMRGDAAALAALYSRKGDSGRTKASTRRRCAGTRAECELSDRSRASSNRSIGFVFRSATRRRGSARARCGTASSGARRWCRMRGRRARCMSSRTPTTCSTSRTPRSEARPARVSAISRYRSTKSSATSSARPTR